MAQKGFAVISGSNAVVAKIMENGTVVFGADARTPVTMTVSGSTTFTGSLNIKLDGAAGDSTTVLKVNGSGVASVGKLSGSDIAVQETGGVTGSTVQAALQNLANSISSVDSTLSISGDSGAGTVSTSDTLIVSGGKNIDTLWDQANHKLTVDLTDSVTLTGNLNAASASLSGDLTVDGNLVIKGQTTVVDTTNLLVEDKIIVLGSSSASTSNDDSGFIFQQASTRYAFGMDSTDNVFRLGTTLSEPSGPDLDINTDGTLKLGTLSGSTVQATTVSASLLEVSTSARIQTLTVSNGLTVSAGSVTLPAGTIQNSALSASSLTVAAGNGLKNGGLVALGDSVTLDVDLNDLDPKLTSIVAADSIAIVDSEGGSASKKVTLANVITASAAAMAGTGLSASSGKLSINTSIAVSGSSDEIDVAIGNGSFGANGLLDLSSNSVLKIGLPESVKITTDLTVGNDLLVSGSATLGASSAEQVTVVGKFQAPIFTSASLPSVYVSAPANYSGHMFFLQGSSSLEQEGVFAQANKWYFNENGEWFASPFYGA